MSCCCCSSRSTERNAAPCGTVRSRTAVAAPGVTAAALMDFHTHTPATAPPSSNTSSVVEMMRLIIQRTHPSDQRLRGCSDAKPTAVQLMHGQHADARVGQEQTTAAAKRVEFHVPHLH